MLGLLRGSAAIVKNLGPAIRGYGTSVRKFAETSPYFDDVLILAIGGTCWWSGFKMYRKNGSTWLKM